MGVCGRDYIPSGAPQTTDNVMTSRSNPRVFIGLADQLQSIAKSAGRY